MINARTISQIQKPKKDEAVKRKRNLASYVPDDVKARIVELYKSGMSKRRIGELLTEEGVESPPMTIPWGTNAITSVLDADK